MDLVADLIEALPSLTIQDFAPIYGTISVRDEKNGEGAYIDKWEYSKPIPNGFTVGK